jgi:hypothetical protein
VQIDQKGMILGDPARLRADILMDPTAGLYRADVATWYLDSRETRWGWKPRATLVGPHGTTYEFLSGDSPLGIGRSYITASAYSNSTRILAATSKPGARWIALSDDPARPGYGFRRTDFFDDVSTGQSGDTWLFGCEGGVNPWLS